MTKKEMDEFIQLYKDQLEFYREQLETLRTENEQLRQQNFSLQDGLLNVRAPEAYRDLQADRAPADGLTIEEKEKRRVYNEEVAAHLQNLERPTFESPDDFSYFMGRVLNEKGPEVGSESLHGNDES
jgi:regulator of replication initiation timing